MFKIGDGLDEVHKLESKAGYYIGYMIIKRKYNREYAYLALDYLKAAVKRLEEVIAHVEKK